MRCQGVLMGAALLVLSATVRAATIDIAPMLAPAKKETANPPAAPPAKDDAARKAASPKSFADYDYVHASDVSEDIYGRSHDGGALSGNADDRHESSQPPPPMRLDSRDFTGGVGYGQNGDMGYLGGYGRFGSYNGASSMKGAAARFGVWHGYNAHNGLGNGY